MPVKKPTVAPKPKLEKQPYFPKKIIAEYQCPVCKEIFSEELRQGVVISSGYDCVKCNVKMVRTIK